VLDSNPAELLKEDWLGEEVIPPQERVNRVAHFISMPYAKTTLDWIAYGKVNTWGQADMDE
jgi:hypothetical protein